MACWPRGLAWLAVMALTACASVKPPGAAEDTLSGRLSVRVEALGNQPMRSVSGNFELQGSSSAGQLSLSSPLGTVLAQAQWSSQQAWLKTSEGQTAYPDLDSLTQQMLGETLPVAALFGWLRGRPWEGAPSQDGAVAGPGFQQLGWQIDLARFDEGWVVAQRLQPLPQVTVRARLDRP